MLCNQCGQLTSNPKFCSRSCSAIFTNRKRSLLTAEDKVCRICKISIFRRQGLCRDCYLNIIKFKFYRDYLTLTIADILVPNTRFRETTRVRENARKLWSNLKLPNSCELCGYSKHVHICHIKPIKDFDLGAPLREVNSLQNLVSLCPNHHWEFDNNKFSESEFDKIHVVCELQNRLKRGEVENETL